MRPCRAEGIARKKARVGFDVNRDRRNFSEKLHQSPEGGGPFIAELDYDAVLSLPYG